jgi:hypothetical protein
VFEQDTKDVIEMQHFQAAERRLAEKVEAAKSAVDAVSRAVFEIEQIRGPK